MPVRHLALLMTIVGRERLSRHSRARRREGFGWKRRRL